MASGNSNGPIHKHTQRDASNNEHLDRTSDVTSLASDYSNTTNNTNNNTNNNTYNNTNNTTDIHSLSDVPIQLEELPNQHTKLSFLRRFSTGFSIQSEKSSASMFRRNSRANTEKFNSLGDAHTEGDDDLFGVGYIQHSATRRDSDLEEFPQTFDPIAEEGHEVSTEAADQNPATRRRRSTVVQTINTVGKKFGFWDKDFKQERLKTYSTFLSNYAYLVIGFMATLCIYWGSYYNRNSRYRDLKFLVVLADNPQGSTPAVFAQVVEYFFTKIPQIHALGNFSVVDYQGILQLAQQNNLTITQEVHRQVHHRKYWGAFYVKEFATDAYIQALQAASPDFETAEALLEVVYETGSDFNAVNNYIVTIINSIMQAYYAYILQAPILQNFLSVLTAEEREALINNAPNLLTSIPTFRYIDLFPVNNQLFAGILTIGLIYLVIFTFFQFVFLLPIHTYVASKITGLRYIVSRMLVTQVSYMVLSLSFVVLNTAFQIPFNVTFGNLGFLVIWMICFLIMSSLGSCIEALVLICFQIKQQLIGFIMLFVAVLNVAPVVSPIVLCPSFYRYGYGFPIYNAYMLMHVCYFNAWKGRVGLQIGVLCIWIVISNIILPLVMIDIGKKMKKAAADKAAEEAERIAAEDLAAEQEEEKEEGAKDATGTLRRSLMRKISRQLTKEEVESIIDEDVQRQQVDILEQQGGDRLL